MNRRIRRGPVKLNEADEVVPAISPQAEQQQPQHHDGDEPIEEEDEEEKISESSMSPNSSNNATWSTWLSGWAGRTARGLDRLYEIANQPVSLKSPSPPGSLHGAIEDDRRRAAESLNDIILHAQNKQPSSESPEQPSSPSGLFGPLDAASDALAAKLQQFGGGEEQERERVTPSPKTESVQQPTTSYVRDQLSKLSRTTASLASRARDQWQAQLAAVDRTDPHRGVDDAFRLYGGGAFCDAVQRRDGAAQRQLRLRLRSLTPPQLAAVSPRLSELDGLFDSERILESVVFIESTNVAKLIVEVSSLVEGVYCDLLLFFS